MAPFLIILGLLRAVGMPSAASAGEPRHETRCAIETVYGLKSTVEKVGNHVGITIITIPQITIDGSSCKTPFPNGWFMALLYPHEIVETL